MPTLNWIGREAVENYHNQVPFHLLWCNAELSVGDAESGNLLGLKAGWMCLSILYNLGK